MASEWCWKCEGARRGFRKCGECDFYACDHCWKFSEKCPECKAQKMVMKEVLA